MGGDRLLSPLAGCATLDRECKELAGQPYGSVLLGLVAAGLLLYGLYCLVEARYRKL